MNNETFELIIKEQIERSESVLITKAKEYATEDRLHNFRIAASLQGGTMEQALAGFLAKHIVSIYDMCYSGNRYGIDQWNEKITDSINYLLILRAVIEDSDNSSQK